MANDKGKGGLIIIVILFLCVVMSIALLVVGGVGASFAFSASPAPAPAPAPAAPTKASASPPTETETKVSDDGRCGPNNGDKKCSGKQCCSKSGWCGGEKGVNSAWCVNIDKGWWNGRYDGEEKAPDAAPVEVEGGYVKHKGKFLPTANDTDVDWNTGNVRPTSGKRVKKASNCIAKCDALEKCKGFTYKPSLFERNRRCWLKTDKVQTETLTDWHEYDTYIKK